MTTNFLDILNYFFFEGLDEKYFVNYPDMRKYLQDGKFEDFRSEIYRELKINSESILNNKSIDTQIERFEKGINEFENSNFYNLMEAIEGFDKSTMSNGIKLKEIAIDFLNELKILRESKSPQQKKELNKDNSYSQKQIAIAYYVMGITITEKNAKGIIEKHSTTKSKKILQKLITKTNQLTVLTNNKTTDTKHLRDLKEAKRLLSGIKMKKSKHDINFIIEVV